MMNQNAKKKRPQGRVQYQVYQALQEHGKWHRGCGWVWDTNYRTGLIMESLVRRGFAIRKADTYWPVHHE